MRNIQHCYNIEGISRHANDLTSVCSWVEELSSLPYNPVLVFKPQGTPQLPSMENISVNNFVLGIQTEFQRDMLKKFGNSCICMDGTHGTNVYDFNLITILVIDKYGNTYGIYSVYSSFTTSLRKVSYPCLSMPEQVH